MLSDAIIMTIIATSAATIGLLFKYSILSNCTIIKCCWGCFETEKPENHITGIKDDGSQIKIEIQEEKDIEKGK